MNSALWAAAPLKRWVSIRPSNVDKHSIVGDQRVRLCNYVDVYKNEHITDAMELMEATAADAQIERFTLAAGDVIVTKDSEEPTDIGIPAYVPRDLPGVVCGYHLALLRPETRNLYGGFLYWALQSAEAQAYFTTAATGITRYALSINDISMLPLRVPPRTEQQRIANFLDERTARIDALIAEKQRLLNLLAEQKLSIAERVIAPAPTRKGVKLGFHVELLPGFAFPSEEFTRDPDDIPLLRGVNVTPAGIRWEEVVYWTREYDPGLERFRVEKGDVVFGMDRPWVSSGARVAIVDEGSSGSFLLQRVCRLRGGVKFDQRFLFYTLASDEFRQSVEIELTGVSVPHISPEQIVRFKVPVLTLEEQRARCELADREVRSIEQLELHATDMLQTLREYRSSLISAAVTGQLDIAHFQVPA